MEVSRKCEALLRLLALAVLVLTACLIRTNTQTKLLFGFYRKKATFKDLDAYVVSLYVDLAAAGYNLLQFIRCLSPRFLQPSAGTKLTVLPCDVIQYWLCFLLDQATAYLVFAANCSATALSVMAVTGSKSLQWMKLCDKYTRFCYQAGGHLFCGVVASLLLAAVASASAFNLFRFYSPKYFMSRKT
ncbi:hypothetical protein Nepgr_019651 [Nepenthes gracilis]|uniref:CASP-like protein n=1 Tax=Nepenthes gracilis TaxID=150966 RepID=A0AAD3STX9_NEPGR|nr:hypothetical protein Nepgr_019651 [Nepenthes gracilis]